MADTISPKSAMVLLLLSSKNSNDSDGNQTGDLKIANQDCATGAKSAMCSRLTHPFTYCNMCLSYMIYISLDAYCIIY